MTTSIEHRDVSQAVWNGGASVTCACGERHIGRSYASAFSKQVKHRKDADGSHEQ